MKAGWWLHECSDDTPVVSHYFESGLGSICMPNDISRGSSCCRPWNVAQDVGRIPLCEACKRAIRSSLEVKPLSREMRISLRRNSIMSQRFQAASEDDRRAPERFPEKKK